MNSPFRILGTIAGGLFVLTASTAARLPPLTVESAAFPGEGGSSLLEVYIFVPPGEGADPDPRLLQVVVKQPNGTRLGESSRVVPGSTTPLVQVWRFPVVPGKLRIQAQVLDMDRRVLGVVEPDVLIPDFAGEGLAVSTPVFGILPGRGSGSPEGLPQRGGILPVPGRRVTGERDSVGVYLLVGREGDGVGAAPPSSEATSGVPTPDAETVDIHAELWRGPAIEFRDSVRVLLEPTAEYVLRHPVSGLADEEYHLKLRVRSGRIEVFREILFRVAIGGRELLADPVLVRTVLGYVATREERLEWEAAAEDSLPRLWTRFWARRDPTLGTDRNEARDLFVERVQEAGRRFGGIVPGWRTDRGRIYIRHGEPERIDRILPHGTSPATETWIYGGGGRSYVFQDAEGYGDYQLTGGARD